MYMITGATLNKELLFSTREKLDLLTHNLLSLCQEFGSEMRAWAVFPNHYHLFGPSPEAEGAAGVLAQRLHGRTSRALNLIDQEPGRKVWFQFWDTLLTSEKTFYTRLRYVTENPVKHGLVKDPTEYQWCSARWFRSFADPAFYRTVQSFEIDQANVGDDDHELSNWRLDN